MSIFPKHKEHHRGSIGQAAEDHPDSEARVDAIIASIRDGSAGAVTTSAGERLEVITAEEPIRAWKGVVLGATKNTVHLRSAGTNHSMSSSLSQAACLKGFQGIFYGSAPPEPHEAPGPSCECGFYGVKDIAGSYGDVIAEVDLSGTVIEHELGYRAQYQQVLSIGIRNASAFCEGTFLCPNQPDLIAFGEDITMGAVCADKK